MAHTDVTCVECGAICTLEEAAKKGWKEEGKRWLCDACVKVVEKVGGNLLRRLGRWLKKKLKL